MTFRHLCSGKTLLNFAMVFSAYLFFSGVEFLVRRLLFVEQMPESTRHLMIEFFRNAPGPLIAFIAQFVVCLALLAAFAEVLRALMGLRSPLPVALYLVLTSIAGNLSEIPQVFVSFVSQTTLLIAQGLQIILLISLPLACAICAIRSKNIPQISKTTIAILLLVCVSFFNARGPSPFDRIDRSPLPKLASGSILVLSIDSLRPDFVAAYVQAHPDSEIARLASSSVRFEKIITSTAKTHASLTALLTGERPEKNTFRDNIYPGFLETDEVYATRGLLPVLKRLGFSTRMFIDETKFAPFSSGRGFDKATAPPYGYIDLFITEVFSSTLFWSYFANPIGEFLIPNSKLNYAFALGYKRSNLRPAVYHNLASDGSKPVFLLAHTCAIHYPGASRVPYLERYQTTPARLVTRYPNFFKMERLEDSDLAQFRNLARGNFDLLMDEFVEPVLKDLRETGAIDKIHLLIMSDHGETFWKPGLKYSRLQLPYHGQPALLDEDSQIMFGMLHSPLLKSESIESVQSITDLTKILERLVEDPRPQSIATQLDPNPMRYSESGMIGYGIFNSILNFERRLPIDGYDFTDRGGLKLRPNQVPNLVLQKTRSIFFGDHHWSFFPTEFGYEVVVCKVPECRARRPEDAGEFDLVLEELAKQSSIDRNNGIAFRFVRTSISSGDVALETEPETKLNPVAAWYGGVNSLNLKGDVLSAYKIWLPLLIDGEASDDVKFRTFQSLMGICSVSLSKKRCTEFHAWVADPKGARPQFRRWADMDNQWSEYLRNSPDLESFATMFAVRPIAASLLNDGFAQSVDESVKLKSSVPLRTFVETNRGRAILEATFFRRFWNAVSISEPLNRIEMTNEIAQVREKFRVELSMHFAEVDVAWLQFLRVYSRATNQSFFREEARRFLREGRVPYQAATGTIIPQALGIRDLACFRQKILQFLNDQMPARKNSQDSWQFDLYKRAENLRGRCAR
ncbi:hypothetical protein BH10BDE1_BH10BDE1_08000 [soil metagenome]